MEEALFDTRLYREFAQLEDQILAAVNEVLAARGLLLQAGTVVDATLIALPISTKNKYRARHPAMHSSKKGEQMYFDSKAHAGADAVVHTVRGTSGNVHDITGGMVIKRQCGHAKARYRGTTALLNEKFGLKRAKLSRLCGKCLATQAGLAHRHSQTRRTKVLTAGSS